MNFPPPAFPPQSNASIILPEDLIMEILSRLNVKSLMEVKCVCKSWNALISDPIFIKKHLNLSKRNPHLTTLHSKTHACSSNTVATISVTRLLQSKSNFIDSHFSFNNIDCDGIVGSCNGLVCFHRYYYCWDFEYPKHLFYFCNLATGTKSETFLSLPLSREFSYGFGYDNSSDTYKAVMLGFRNQVITRAKVFTLGDDFWRYIQSLLPGDVAPCSSIHDDNNSVYLSNSICWLFQKNHTTKKFVIISLDLGTETFTQMLLPSCCDELVPLDNPTLCVLMDSICLSHDFKPYDHLVIWQMKEFGVEESWTQFLKISYLNLGLNYIELNFYGSAFQVIPLCLSENDTTLILTNKVGNQAIIYNWRDNGVEKIEMANGIRWSAAKDYVESLVSTY